VTRAGRQPRLKELAAELGLSITTVSRALAGYSDVSPATRARAAAAAERLGYVPSQAGRMLVSGRTDFIGMVLPVGEGRMIDAFVGAFVAGLSEGLAARKKDLFIGTVPQSRSKLDVLRHIVDGARADALVLFRTETDDPHVRFLLDRQFPFVCHGRVLTETRPYVWFDTDGEAALAEAVRMLIGLGHRDFGMMTVAEPYTFAALRRRGAEAALAAAGLELPAAALVAVPMADPAAARAAAERLIRMSPRPTAVLAVVDSLALAFLEVARGMAVAVPEDVSVVGFDDVPVSAYSTPPLSTFDQQARRGAGVVAEMVVGVIENGVEPVRSRLARAEFVGRGSHGPAPRTRRGATAA
jgi:LacI family transcriptional regulator